MCRRITICLAVLLVLLTGASLANAAQAFNTENPKTVLDGVYTPAQAARGEAAFRSNCASCHEGTKPEGPLLTAPAFLDHWREDKLDGLFTDIKTNTPGGRPGTSPRAARGARGRRRW